MSLKLENKIAVTTGGSAGIGLATAKSFAAQGAKVAIRSLGRSFSAELLPRGKRVNILTPGPVDTNVFATVTATQGEADAFKASMGEVIPIKRIDKVEELAAAALYLSTADFAYVVGAELLLDGGLRSL